MSSSKEYLDFILGQLSELEDVSYRTMMGEFILYYKGKIVGGIYDDRLLVKDVKSAVCYMKHTAYELPYEGAKKMLLVDNVDDKTYLTRLFDAMYEELPTQNSKSKLITEELSKLPNIGKTVEKQLNQAGIDSIDKLKKLGAKAAWMKIQAIDESACINLLMALEGAIQGVKKTMLSDEVKSDLKSFYGCHKK